MKFSEKNPWQTKTEQTVYENEWIKVTHREVITPSNTEGVYGVVHFKNWAIGIIPLDSEGYTYIVGQYRYPLNKYSWEIPEGGGLKEKSVLESAKRELQEETGITAGKWTEILRMDLSNSATDEQGFIYVAQQLSYGQANPEETEQLKIRKIHFNELYQMVMNGEITDSLSVAGTLKLKCLIDEGKISW